MSFIRNTAFFVFPLLSGIFVLADPLIRTLLTDKWEGAIWILQVLCPVGLCFVFSTFNMNVFNATGRTGMALKSEVLKKSVDVAIIVVAVTISFEALVWSQVVIAVFEMFVNMTCTKKQIALKLLVQFGSVTGILLCSVLMALSVAIVTSFIEAGIGKLIVGFVVGVIVYAGLCWIFDVNDIQRVIRGKISK